MTSFGIQPIIGMQVNISQNEKNTGEVVLLAKNEKGYKNLLILTSSLSSSNYNDKYISDHELEKHTEGLLLLTGGVENGFIGKPASQITKI